MLSSMTKREIVDEIVIEIVIVEDVEHLVDDDLDTLDKIMESLEVGT